MYVLNLCHNFAKCERVKKWLILPEGLSASYRSSDMLFMFSFISHNTRDAIIKDILRRLNDSCSGDNRSAIYILY